MGILLKNSNLLSGLQAYRHLWRRQTYRALVVEVRQPLCAGSVRKCSTSHSLEPDSRVAGALTRVTPGSMKDLNIRQHRARERPGPGALSGWGIGPGM